MIENGKYVTCGELILSSYWQTQSSSSTRIEFLLGLSLALTACRVWWWNVGWEEEERKHLDGCPETLQVHRLEHEVLLEDVDSKAPVTIETDGRPEEYLADKAQGGHLLPLLLTPGVHTQ